MLRLLPPVLMAMAAVTNAVTAPPAQQYDGPTPPAADLPYIKHATNLIATEPVEAKEQKSRDDVLYTIDGENSPSKTPLALPIFIIKSDKLNPESLGLYRLESKGGRRELTDSAKKGAAPLYVQVTRLSGDGLYKLDVYNSLDPGEYALVVQGSNRMFCFQVF